MKLEFPKRNGKPYIRIRFRHKKIPYLLSLGPAFPESNIDSANEILEILKSDIANGVFTGDLTKYKRRQKRKTLGLIPVIQSFHDNDGLCASLCNRLTEYGEIRTLNQAKAFLSTMDHLAPSTQRKYLKLLKRASPGLFSHLTVKRKAMPKVPVVFTHEELKQIFSYFKENNPHYYPVIRCLADLGLRPQEALGLNLGDWDYYVSSLTIARAVDRKGNLKSTKNRSIRTHRINRDGELYSLLRNLPSCLRYLPGDPTDIPLFTAKETGNRISYLNLRYHFDRCLDHLNIKGKTLYCLRRSFVSNCVIHKKLDVSTTAKLAGHTPAVLVKHYLGSYEHTESLDLYEDL